MELVQRGVSRLCAECRALRGLHYLILILPFNVGINVNFIPISMGGKLGSEKLSDVSKAVQTAQLDLNPHIRLQSPLP